MDSTMALRIAVIRGDGIGPELLDAALTVLTAVTSVSPGLSLSYVEIDAGAERFRCCHPDSTS